MYESKLLYCFELFVAFKAPANMPRCCMRCPNQRCHAAMVYRYSMQPELFSEQELTECGNGGLYNKCAL